MLSLRLPVTLVPSLAEQSFVLHERLITELLNITVGTREPGVRFTLVLSDGLGSAASKLEPNRHRRHHILEMVVSGLVYPPCPRVRWASTKKPGLVS